MPKPFCYDYPRPAVTVDLVLFSFEDRLLRVLLIKRGKPPYEGQWALPGGFLDLDETAEAAARRELIEETGAKSPDHLRPLGFFDAVDRDPRGRVISLAFAALISPPAPELTAGDDAREARWINLDEALGLAFDHHLILESAINWLRADIIECPAGAALLSRRFTRDEPKALLQALHGHARSLPAWLRHLEARKLIKRTSPNAATYQRLPPPKVSGKSAS